MPSTKYKAPEPTLREIIGVKENHDFLAMVPIESIKPSKTNDMFRESTDFKDESIKELAASIKEKGLLQPILLRAEGNGGFILVAGERRYRACLSLDMKEIPAYVKEMTEEEAFELQLTENLQRKDVHPMKEAKAYRHLTGTGKYSTQELALRFGKSETYVLQRLRLNSLLPEIAKDFEKDDLSLAQALVIARLEKADQEEVLEQNKNNNGSLNSNRNYYASAQELENYIAEEITRELSKVPWDLSDATIVPKAGACTACGKRSGAQALLFADIKEKDRCFDSACFKSKLNACLFIKVKKLVEDKPDTIFLVSGGYKVDKPDQRIASYLSSQKIKPLTSESYSPNNYYQHKKAIKGFYINGDQAGQFKQVYVAGPATKAVNGSAKGEQKVTAEDIKESIERIKERTKRAAELDAEKLYDRILEAMCKDEILARDNREASPSEYGFLAGLIYDRLDYSKQEVFDKYFGFTKIKKDEDRAQAFVDLGALKVIQMVRTIAARTTSREHAHDSDMGILVARMAKDWGIPVDQFKNEQDFERAAREGRAAQRIKELQAQLKPAPKKVKA